MSVARLLFALSYVVFSCCSAEVHTASDGPWSALNALLKDVQFKVAPRTFYNSSTLFIVLTDTGYLQNVSIGDFEMSSKIENEDEYDVRVVLTNIEIVLTGPFGLGLAGTPHDGMATWTLQLPTVDFTLEFASPSTSQGKPPASVDLVCKLKGETVRLKCSGRGFLFNAACTGIEAALVTGSLVTPIITSFVCDALQSTVKGLNPTLTNISKALTSRDRPLPPLPPVPAGEDAPGLEADLPFSSLPFWLAETVVKNVFNVPSPQDAHSLVINEVIDQFFPRGVFTSNTSLEIPIHGTASVHINSTVQQFYVNHLDNITDFDVFSVVSNHTVESNFSTSHIYAGGVVATSVTISDAIIEGGGRFALLSNFTADFGASLYQRSVIGLNSTTLSEIQIGSLHESGAVHCLFDALNVLNLTYFTLAPKGFNLTLNSTVTEPVLPASGGLNALFNSFVQALLLMYGRSVSRATPYTIETELRPVLNAILQAFVHDSGSQCPRPSKQTGLLDFRENVLVEGFDLLVDEIFGKIPSDYSINKVVSALLEASTSGWNGSAIVSHHTKTSVLNKPIHSNPQDVDLGYVRISIGNWTISGLNAISALDVFLPNPMNGSELDTIIVFSAEEPLYVAFDYGLYWVGKGDDIDDNFRLELAFYNTTLELDAALMILKDPFYNLTLNQSLLLSCVYPTMMPHGLRFPVTGLMSDLVTMRVSCHKCSGPGFQAWIDNLEKPGADEAATDLFNGLMESTIDHLRSPAAEATFDRHQREAVCGEPFSQPEQVVHTYADWGSKVQILLLAVIPICFVLGLGIYTAFRVRKVLSQRAEESRPLLLNNVGMNCDNEREGKADSWWDTLRCSESVCGHPVVPKSVKVFVCIALVVIVPLQLSAQLYHAAVSISARVEIAGQAKLVSVYDYTTIKFSRDGFNGGLWVLALGIGSACFTWVWIKHALLTWLFFVPPTVLSQKSRNKALGLLDYTAKWSFIDSVLSILLVTLVDMTITLPLNWDLLWAPNLLVTEVLVKSYYGFYMFFLTQILTTLIIQVVLLQNRNVITSTRAELLNDADDQSAHSGRSSVSITWFEDGADDNAKESLRAHMHTQFDLLLGCFVHPEDGQKRSRISLPGRVIIFFSLVICIATVVYGFSSHFVGVKNTGAIVGLINLAPDVEAERKFTLYDIMTHFVDRSTGHAQKALHIVCPTSTHSFSF
ncbi:hypothetical protein DIPPA_34217 [Diplonema papillatum]|nr:hypothetical protein DIPPA_34217 [Diplonema papillatum]